MIQRLHISGFKCFRDLELPRLGRINLFVGKNNTGKSSILEAVDLFASDSAASMLKACARRIDERLQHQPWRPYDTTGAAPLARLLVSLFHREQGKTLRSTIEIVSDDPKNQIRVDASAFDIGNLEYELRNLAERANSPLWSIILPLMLDGGLRIKRGSSKSTSQALRGFNDMFLQRNEGAPSSRPNSKAAPKIFLPSRGLTEGDSASAWSGALKQGRYETILAWMRFIEPEITDLQYLLDEHSTDPFPHLRINGDGEFVPLASLGDGLTRIFHLALAMGSAEKGILLIDEFENGLHWSVQKQLWQAIGKAAQNFDMQVFATTHSNDCLRALAAAQKDQLFEDPVCVYRLERKGDEIIARDLPLDVIDSALEFNVEVR